MTKRYLNQNDKFVRELINYVEPNFNFNFKPINRLKADNKVDSINKNELLMNLKKQIFSIQNCNLKENSKKTSKKISSGDGKIKIKKNSQGFAYLNDDKTICKVSSEILAVIKEGRYFGEVHAKCSNNTNFNCNYCSFNI